MGGYFALRLGSSCYSDKITHQSGICSKFTILTLIFSHFCNWFHVTPDKFCPMNSKTILAVQCQGNVEKVLDLFLKTASRGSTPTIMDAVFVYWEIGMMEEGMKIPKRAAKQGLPMYLT
ncbi:F-box protein [Artemisia annua]|uniref:F-box protein n=1 Tax=Artemisia annua TaxID=35608 RepID=A0A2U1KBQ0_ARTAN|nr:F-box protein [Artemisia annua]